MANKINKQKETVKAKRDFTQVKRMFMLLAVASAIYSIATIALGTGDEILPKALTAPLATWAVVELVKRFSK